MGSGSPVPNDWTTRPLGELAEIFDGPHATPKKTEDGPVFLGISSLDNGRLDLSDVAHISEDDFKKWTRRITPRPDDVVFSYETRLGEAALIPEGLRCCLGRRTGLLRTRSPELIPRYLLYAYLGPYFQRVIRERTIHGSTVNRIPLKDMGRFPIVLPPLTEQVRIAATLGALDDKIDSNRRLATLLEETVATVFRARFVDFVGESNFAETELGRTPQGWTVAPIADVLKIVGGGTPSTREPQYWDGGTHCWATPKDLAGANSPVLLATKRHITDDGVDRVSSKLLPKRTVLLSSRAPVGYTTISMVEVAVNQGFIAIPPSASVPSEYVLLWLHTNMDRIKAHAGGTTFAEISKRAFRPLLMLVPPAALLTEFAQVARPMFDLITAQERESRALSHIRESLLPKLISGEIRVPDTTDLDEAVGLATKKAAA